MIFIAEKHSSIMQELFDSESLSSSKGTGMTRVQALRHMFEKKSVSTDMSDSPINPCKLKVT